MIKPRQDNVLLRFIERPTETASGIIIPKTVSESRVGTRQAEVVAVGPGHYTPQGKFIPVEVTPGDRVLVDSLSGQDYSMDLYRPRQNKGSEWGDDRATYRMVRQDEILCVIERDERHDTMPSPAMPDGTFIADGQAIVP